MSAFDRYNFIATGHLQLFPSLRKAKPCRRLWLAGLAMAAFLLTLVIGNGLIARDKSVTREMLGHDFLAFYTAGSFLREGRFHELYQLEPVKNFEQATSKSAGLEVGKSFGPWWNPPFYALVFEPLAALPYADALNIWRWISLASIIVAIGLLALIVARVCNPCAVVFESESHSMGDEISNTPRTGYKPVPRWSGWRNWALVPLLIVVSMPFIQAISHGQNTYTSLLLLTATVWLWRTEKRLFAGMVGGLLFYKPQLGAVVAVMMVLDLGWEALAGFAVTGLALLAITVVRMPGSLTDYLHLLPANVRWMQVEHEYLWERHVTLKAFWRLMLQGRDAGEMHPITQALTLVTTLCVGGGLLLVGLRQRFHGISAIGRDRLIAATIATMPLLMPFYFDYDLLLLAIPATLYAAERVHHPRLRSTKDLSLTQTWVALFFWLFFNPAIASRTHLNITVLLLFALAMILVNRAARRDEIAEDKPQLPSHDLRLAA